MVTKNGKNEGIGITSIVIIVILAVFGLYFFFSSSSQTGAKNKDVTNVPLEAPSPLPDDIEK